MNDEKRIERLRAIGLRGKLPDVLTETVLEAVRTRPQGEVYQLSDGRVPGLALEVGATGAATFWLNYKTTKGIRRRFKIGLAGAIALSDARALAMRALADVAADKDPAADRKAARATAQSVRGYLEDVYGPKVLAHRKDGGAPTSKDGKSSGTYRRLLSPAWAPLLDVQLAQVSRDVIEKVLADRRREGKQAGTLLRDWSAFRAMLSDAVDRGQLAAVPMAKRPEPIRKLRGNQRVRYLGQRDTDEERAQGLDGEEERCRKALAAFQSNEPGGGDFLRCVAGLALATGCRRGELVRLGDKIVNMRERRIDLTPEITKSNKARTVHLGDDALAALKLWKIRGKGGELFPGEGKPEDVAERWEHRITQREWPRFCEEAKLTDFHFHDLRHTFAVRLLRSCGSLAKVRDALGHSSVSQTEKYAHVAETEVREAVLGMQATSR